MQTAKQKLKRAAPWLFLLLVLAGLAAGLCRGGSLRRAAAFPLRGLWLPLAAYLLKALGGAIGVPPLPLCLAQYGLLLLFCWFNRRQPRWCAPFALGTALMLRRPGACLLYTSDAADD